MQNVLEALSGASKIDQHPKLQHKIHLSPSVKRHLVI